MGSDELTFVIFLLYQIAEELKKTPSDVYKALSDARVISEYIVPCYDTLHTLGSKYLVDDITEMVRERGVEI